MIIRKIVQEAKPLIRIIKKEAEEVATSSIKIVPKAQAPRPKMTIKPSVAQTTFEEGLGTNIIAEQNRAMVNARQQVQTLRTTNTIRIGRPTSQACISPHASDYQRLCSPHMTLTEAEELSRLFYEDTGLILHCPTNRTHLFSIALNSIYSAVKQGTFPKDIKHVLIGHGMGSSKAKTWAMEGLSLKNGEVVEVIPYINKSIPKGEKVLVCSCESRGLGQIAGKPGIGNEVELSLECEGEPGKVVRSGIDRIIGHYTLTGGYVPYEMYIKPKV